MTFDSDSLTRVLAVWPCQADIVPYGVHPSICGTNLLSLDEIQVNGEGDGNTEIMLFSDI